MSIRAGLKFQACLSKGIGMVGLDAVHEEDRNHSLSVENWERVKKHCCLNIVL
jgi:hypothetical protein